MQGGGRGPIERVRACAVCVHAGRLLCVRLRDPHTRIARLFVPGGQIEPGETAAAAAERELFEETGYRARVDPASEHVIRYDYPWNGVVMDCTTHFFRAELTPSEQRPERVNDASYHEGVHWLELNQVATTLGFHEPMLRALKHLLT